MNIVLLVVDSLRAASLETCTGTGPRTPFLRELSAQSISFRRAYATECWTLPTHCSMFTGLLPSEHGAHFQTMGYTRPAPTVAELLSQAGYHTEVVTRNFIFDGTIPGITRGFRKNTQLLSDAGRLNPFALFLAISKPRFRRRIRTTGFFHPLQRENRRFLSTFARALMPADGLVLEYALSQMARYRQQRIPYFIFCNLYDVHAPYPPSPKSILRPFWSPRGCIENFTVPHALSCLGSHTYLRPGFRLSGHSRRMLLDRYHRAIELMDAKLADFYAGTRSAGLLDDTLLIITSDHGEAFGEHGLYLHDASAYDTHLHVPLWIHHPGRPCENVDDVVSTRDLFGLIRDVGLGHNLERTILNRPYREGHPVALAEHFYYPHAPEIDPRYRQNLKAMVAGTQKVIVRDQQVEYYDLGDDPAEQEPRSGRWGEIEAAWRHAGVPASAISLALTQMRRWAGAAPVGETRPRINGSTCVELVAARAQLS